MTRDRVMLRTRKRSSIQDGRGTMNITMTRAIRATGSTSLYLAVNFGVASATGSAIHHLPQGRKDAERSLFQPQQSAWNKVSNSSPPRLRAFAADVCAHAGLPSARAGAG